MGFGESTQGNQRKLDGPGKVSTELSLVNLEAKNLHPKPECNQPLRKGQRPGFLLKPHRQCSAGVASDKEEFNKIQTRNSNQTGEQVANDLDSCRNSKLTMT
ncbi:hypothetical protein OsI_33464 [Oryza sativa Indica Group]|uniref:Uncharacterized protein n=1 Tax=Oryza sativa subsp. indica TaxID=39946 RepID=B8BGP3_ORYSI|nr:hypothetical protein OsI_33464 [Oryza sativa Indica Group]